MNSAWPVLFSCFMSEVRHYRFSQRRAFFAQLTEIVHSRVGFPVAWPDALIFLEPDDWKKAARLAGIESEDFRQEHGGEK